MARTEMISFDEAYTRTIASINHLPTEKLTLERLNGRALAEDVYALVDSPTANVSLKDGYAVRSGDIAGASPDDPVRLQVVGSVAAGGEVSRGVDAGTAVRILSGAPIPPGAQAILADEFAIYEDGFVLVTNNAEPGRNILPLGTDINKGACILSTGTVLQPTQVGLLAAAGHSEVSVVRLPGIAIIATGDEVIAPGKLISKGKLYASNLVTLASWCSRYGMKPITSVVRDDPELIREKLVASLASQDAIVTSGGAWRGDRDLVIHLLDELGWEKVFHSVKMGPGKAVGFGLYKGKPVFCLPGGPPSNHMAFLQLVIPGLHKMMGYTRYGLPTIFAQLTESISGQSNWTQFVHVKLEKNDEQWKAIPLRMKSRLSEMAVANGIANIPEGLEDVSRGSLVEVQQF